MIDCEFKKVVEYIYVFVEFILGYKVCFVFVMQDNGYFVGFFGDGVNDILVLNEVNVGIFVDMVVDVVKDVVDVVLL